MGIYTSAAFSAATGLLTVAAGASVLVRREDTGAIAAIKSDRAGTTPLANPFTVGADGMFSFYAAGIVQGYRVTIETAGSPTETVDARNQPIGTAQELDATAFAATLLDDETAAEARSTLGAQQDLSAIGTETTVTDADYFVMASVGSPEDTRRVLAPTALARAPFPRSYLSGLGMSNAIGSPTDTKRLDVAAGIARDSTNTVNITLSAAMSDGLLQASGAWAAGSMQNKLDTGARANSTFYWVHVIRKDSDESGDWLFSLSRTAPTMPAGYTYFRRIGFVRTDGSGNIIDFVQVGDEFRWRTPQNAVNGGTFTTASRTLVTLTMPTGIKLKVKGSILHSAPASGTTHAIVTDPDCADIAPANNAGTSLTGSDQTATAVHGNEFHEFTDTSARVGTRSTVANTYYLNVHGWTDRRGRDD